MVFAIATLRDASAAATFALAESTAACAALQSGGRFIARLVAHDSLLGQGDGPRGIGILMLVLGLRLHQGGLRTAQLGFGIGHLAGRASSGLAFGIARLPAA